MAERTMVQAINLALRQEMERDETVVLLGEDVGVDGGIFRVTEGLLDAFGEGRVIDTPLAESAIVGSAVGMAINGLRPVAEMQFSGFSYLAFNQIEAHAARMRWRSGGRFAVPMVVRMPYGAGVRALEHHSESREVYWAHTPGLKTVIPSTPRTARALLVSAIRDPDPVIFMEPKQVYRSIKEEVPDEEETLPIGEARRVREGDGLTMVAWGAMLHRTLAAAETLAEEDGVEATVFDLATLAPLDTDAIAESVRRTGRLVVVHEAPQTYGPAAEIAQRVAEAAFLHLEAPVRRVAGWDTMVPYFAREQNYMPDAARILDGARACLSY